MRNYPAKAIAQFAVALFLSAGLASAAPPPGYQLELEDEFDGPALNQDIWSFGFGWGRNSGSFSEDNQERNLTFEDGKAVFKASLENGRYISAAINTKNKAIRDEGYWEARVRITKHISGLDPAFWQKLNNEQWPPEVDIFEFFGTQKAHATTVHWDEGGHKQSGAKHDLGDLTGDFHVYGLEYRRSHIRWYNDGKMIREITPSTHPKLFEQWKADKKYTMLNIHMTDKYNWLGNVDKSNLPVYMYVDYFRMYSPGGPTRIQPKAAPRAVLSQEMLGRSSVWILPLAGKVDAAGRSLPVLDAKNLKGK